MFKKNLLYLVAITLFGQVFFSCNTARPYEFSNRGEAYHSDKVLLKKAPEPANLTTDSQPMNLTADAGNPEPASPKPLFDLRQEKPNPELTNKVTTSVTEQKVISRTEIKELKQALKLYKKQTKNQGSEITGKPTVDIVELIFAIVLPPIGVLLHDDGITNRFWISLVLTLLFFIPGMIYAILVVTDSI